MYLRWNKAGAGGQTVFLLRMAIVCVLMTSCSNTVTQPEPKNVPVAPPRLVSDFFPLRKQAGRRFLVDQTGSPFLLHGEAAWTLLVQLKREEAERYLRDRHERGINTLLMDLLVTDMQAHKIRGANAPCNAYGESPFTIPGDYSRPNEKYFEHVDWVLIRAAELGFLVLLTPSYLGYEGGDQGWYLEMKKNGVEPLKAYGRYLGLRYRSVKNIIWINGGDYNPPERDLMEAIVKGILETDSHAMHSFHGSRGTAARMFLGEKTSWLDVNTIYTDENNVASAAICEYTASPLPFFLIEARYEGEGASEAVVRKQAYQAILSGSCGQVMGNKFIYTFVPGWEGALDSGGARSMTVARSILQKLEWWKLKPVHNGLIAEGVGIGGLRAVSAIAEDRRRVVVYIPSPRYCILKVQRLRGSRIMLRWIDPASGDETSGGKVKLKSLQRLKLRSPERNSSGYGDWILVIDSMT
jgi:hypothetical protein